jgi:hypothetical protein
VLGLVRVDEVSYTAVMLHRSTEVLRFAQGDSMFLDSVFLDSVFFDERTVWVVNAGSLSEGKSGEL